MRLEDAIVAGEQSLTVREAAIVLLAACEARGVNCWLDTEGRLQWDFTNGGCRVRPDEYTEGLALLRDEIRQLLHERELREAIMRSWPPFPQVVQ